MTDGLLENIIQLEKQLQAEVADEEVRAKKWSDRELELLESSFNTTQGLEEERFRSTLKAKKLELQQELGTLEAQAEAASKRLLSLDNETLESVLRQQLAKILPGGDNDHPHGEG